MKLEVDEDSCGSSNLDLDWVRCYICGEASSHLPNYGCNTPIFIPCLLEYFPNSTSKQCIPIPIC